MGLHQIEDLIVSKEKKERGMELVEKLCGNKDALNGMPERFREYTLEHLFGDVWQNDDLALKERSLVTCAILTALGREKEQAFHFAAAKRLGIPREKLLEIAVHCAHYSGWPTAVGAIRTLNQVWPEES